MCLDKLANFEVKQDWGWQFFRRDKFGNLHSFFQQITHDVSYPEEDSDFKEVVTDTWVEDEKSGFADRLYADPSYPTGFHIWVTKVAHKHRREAILKKVYFRNIVAKGHQWNCRVVIVRERYVCDKTKRPPKD